MTNVIHADFTDDDLHVAGYVQASDPGAKGAGKLWIDTTLGTKQWVLKIRNAANSAWETVKDLTTPGAIGGTTPAAGTFTGLTVTGAAAGSGRQLSLKTGTDPSTAALRWSLAMDTDAEGGSAAGSNFEIAAYNDAGGGAHTVFEITRSSYLARFYNALTVDGALVASAGATIAGALAHTGSTLGFFNAAAVARGALALPTGVIQRTTYATGSVTLPQLAGVVMAIITDLRLYGLFS